MRSLVAAGLLVLAGPAAAQTDPLAAARAQAIVGERYDGFLGFAVPPSTTAVRQQAGAVNLRRRALYTDLAQRRGVSPQEVGITAGCSLLARVQVGEAYMLQDGAWRRRAAGEPAPVPAYCTGG